MIHRLKTLQPYFDDVKSGKKSFEIRVNDRDYQVGDMLILEEYDNTDFTTGYTGQVIIKSVTYVLMDCSQYGLKDGYCILGLAENNWIPADYRPVKYDNSDGFPCLITMFGARGNITIPGHYWFYNDRFSHGEEINWISDKKVLAYMPLPEPYKAE